VKPISTQARARFKERNLLWCRAVWGAGIYPT